MSKETGGPAFPELENVAYNSGWRSEPGMSLRDYIAAKAMQGMLSAHVPSGDIPAWSYEMADAMLDARAISKATGESNES